MPRLERRAAHGALVLTLAGLGMLAVHPQSRFYPPCPVYALFHVLCPGCGATRALGWLVRGDLRAAWLANPLVVCGMPFVVAYWALVYRRAAGRERFEWPVFRLLSMVGVGASIVFAILRNGLLW